MRMLLITAVAVVLTACTKNNDFVTESGVEVSRFVTGEGQSLMKDSVVVMQIRMATDEEDEKVLMESTPEQPLALAFDPEMEAGDFQEVLTNLRIGDSVGFQTTVKNLFEETYQSQVPPNIDSAAVVQVNMKLVDQMGKDAYRTYAQKMKEEARAKEAALLEEKATTDGLLIDEHLDSLGVDAQTTASGIRYIKTQEGSGPTAEPGDKITVHYDGRLLTGEKFDSSRDRDKPFSFTIGQGRVIPGWDEGIPLINEGGKGTLYIPSPLAYGARSPSPSIPAYSILVFDVEVLEVEKQEK